MAKSSELRTSSVVAHAEPLVVDKQQTWYNGIYQVIRFGVVGFLNTGIDVLVLNILLRIFPTHNTNLLLIYNSIAFTLGAVNSFYFNKYWTFKKRESAISGEAVRFLIVSLLGIICNDSLIWIAAKMLHPLIMNSFLWANMSKAIAVIGTALVSYFGMRLWVFAGIAEMSQEKKKSFVQLAPSAPVSSLSAQEVQMLPTITHTREQQERQERQEPMMKERQMKLKQSLSIVMPAHNEEVAIRGTVQSVLDAVSQWTEDFEVLVVNDGSKDETYAILKAMAAEEPRVHVINHEVNQGYGAALVSGFEAASKDLVFFMDSDGQFDICDLERFFPLIPYYDAVLGYRINRQDTWLRKLNAWGWKTLVRLVFKLRVRDIDCAFKLYKGEFFRTHPLETRGAMINTEVLYKFTRAGYTYTEVGVHHLPRHGGRATGAKLSVIARAFLEMFTFAGKWSAEERKR